MENHTHTSRCVEQSDGNGCRSVMHLQMQIRGYRRPPVQVYLHDVIQAEMPLWSAYHMCVLSSRLKSFRSLLSTLMPVPLTHPERVVSVVTDYGGGPDVATPCAKGKFCRYSGQAAIPQQRQSAAISSKSARNGMKNNSCNPLGGVVILSHFQYHTALEA